MSEVQIWTDSATAKSRIRSWSLHIGRPPANADIVSLILRIIKTIPVRVRLNWIKAHQDADKTAKKFTVEAQMNMMADVITSNFLERCPSVAKGGPRNSSNYFPTMQASLIINNQGIHISTAERMRQRIKLRKDTNYFGGKYNGNSKVTLVHWDNLTKAYKNQKCTKKIFIARYLHGWLPTGVRRKSMFQGNKNCPMCGNRETNEHKKVQSPKNIYKQETRLSAMSSRAQQVQVGKCVSSSAWLQYIKHILSQRKEKFKINFDPGTSETMKGRVLKAIEQQNQLGLILTLRVILARDGKARFTIQRKISNQQKRSAALGLHRQYINFGK